MVDFVSVAHIERPLPTDRLNRTLAHELCHIATWLISGDLKNPHGTNFRAWGSKVNRYRPDIVVSVSHSNVITMFPGLTDRRDGNAL